MFKQSHGLIVAAFAALALTACGGGSLGEGDEEVPGVQPATLTLLASSPQLSSDAEAISKGVVLTAIVKDQNNVVMSNVPVAFSTVGTAELTVESPAETDGTGRVDAILTTGGDPTNRSVTVKATAGSLTATRVVAVVGTTLDISGPDATQVNTNTSYTATVTDAASNGIVNVVVDLTTSSGTVTPASAVTNSAGQVTFTLRASNASTTITASSLGETATKIISVSTDDFSFLAPAQSAELAIGTAVPVQVRWRRDGTNVPDGTVVNFTATRGSLSSTSATTVGGLATVTINSAQAGLSVLAANGSLAGRPVSANRDIEFVAVRADKLDVQASPANIGTNQSSEITAIVRDPTNNLVKNATVDFSLQDVSGGNLSAASAVTNSQGVAKITYSASSQTSPSEGAVVTGTLRPLKPSDPAPSQGTDTATITVGARAVDITIGTGTPLEDVDSATYGLPFTVIVADSSGNPVPDAEFTLSNVATRYFKGTFAAITAACNNEDSPPHDDILDPGEDIDNDGELDPGRVATVPASVDLGPNGAGTFLLTYPKDRGVFVEIMVTGTATVAGTSTTETRTVLLPIGEGDEEDLPGVSPYGISASCADPN